MAEVAPTPPGVLSSEGHGNLLMRSRSSAAVSVGQGSVIESPSVIFDGAQPLVELEVERLNESIAWLYNAVRALRQQNVSLCGQFTRLDSTLQEWQSAKGAPLASRIGTEASGALASAAAEGDGDIILRLAGIEQDMHDFQHQQGQKQIAAEKLMDMHTKSLKEEIACRLLPKDLDALKVNVKERLDLFETKFLESQGLVDSVIKEESVNERRRFQAQFEALNSKANAQIDEMERTFKTSLQQISNRLDPLERKVQAFAALEGYDDPVDTNVAEDTREPGSCPVEGEIIASDQAPAASPPAASAPAQVSVTRSQSNAGWRQDMQRRIELLECGGGGGCSGDGVAGASGGSAALHNQIVDFHKMHNETHHRLLEYERRIRNVEAELGAESAADQADQDEEARGASKQLDNGDGGGLGDVSAVLPTIEGEDTEVRKDSTKIATAAIQPSTSGKAGGTQDRLRLLEKNTKDLNGEMEYMERRYMQSEKVAKEQLKMVLRNLDYLAKYVSGVDNPTDNDDSQVSENSEVIVPGPGIATGDSGSRAASPSGGRSSVGSRSKATSPGSRGKRSQDPLAWIERRVHAMMRRKKGFSIEGRIRELEKAAEGSPGGLEARFVSVENDITALDPPSLKLLRPELDDVKRDYESFGDNVRRDMQELKCLVGCLEACVPRETRKAVELFKRAAGSDDRRPRSPRQFEVEGSILALREELQSRLSTAESVVKDQCDHVVQIVRNLERRQDSFDSRIGSVHALLDGNAGGEMAALPAPPSPAPLAIGPPPLPVADGVQKHRRTRAASATESDTSNITVLQPRNSGSGLPPHGWARQEAATSS
eukprot:TRINITY_DN67039_c0_g1_i1.p1 TRINITY_DN67039_c0_g1~~TRINITY_DN67039_c0_g1_i1.p1  ORF type:complete len:828 (-),score=175.52 TRINITY_DN67039_c0_g1_i1:138-2621(-)